jgi:hypothetical protein
MLNQMNGGHWQKHSLEKNCKKNWLHTREMKKGTKDTC